MSFGSAISFVYVVCVVYHHSVPIHNSLVSVKTRAHIWQQSKVVINDQLLFRFIWFLSTYFVMQFYFLTFRDICFQNQFGGATAGR